MEDLNIDNYSLEDILNLFKIPIDFDENDLKHAKKLVLKSHPDKSKLDSKYFLFYSKAYKVLFSIYEFKNKTKKDQSTDYTPLQETPKFLDKYIKENNLKNENFVKWFNEEFEKRKDKEHGYDDWLKSDEDVETQNIKFNEMNAFFESKKVVVVHKDVKEYITGNYTSLSLSQEYSSDMFGSLNYSDLKEAHKNSIIPVSMEEYKNKPKNLEEYKRSRVDIKPLSEKESQQFLDSRQKLEDEESVSRAYYYSKKTLESEKANNDFLSKMKYISNKNHD